MLDPNLVYLFNGIEVFLEGGIAKKPNTDIYMYKVQPVYTDAVTWQNKWVKEKDLYVVSKKQLQGKLKQIMTTTFHDHPYLRLASHVLEHGEPSDDRTGTGTINIFHHSMSFDLSDGTIPLLTSKKMHTPAILHEIVWYLSGATDIQYLLDNNVRIWNEWAHEGDLGPIYGANWRQWPIYGETDEPGKFEIVGHVDQLQNIIDTIKNRPHSRRMVVSAWNPQYLPDEAISPEDNVRDGKGALPPCHMLMEFSVRSNGTIDMIMFQRSADVFLGVPFNIAQYSILLHIIANITGKTPGVFTWVGGNVHIYNNHIRQIQTQLTNAPYPSPRFKLTRQLESLDDLKYEDMEIIDYKSHPKITATVSK